MYETSPWSKQVAWTVALSAPTALIFAFHGNLRILFVSIALAVWLLAILFLMRVHYMARYWWFKRLNQKSAVRNWDIGAQWRLGINDSSGKNQFTLHLMFPYAIKELRTRVSITNSDGQFIASGDGANAMGMVFAVYPQYFDGESLGRLSPGEYKYTWVNTIGNEFIGTNRFEIGNDGHVVVPRKISRRIKHNERHAKFRDMRGLKQ